MKGIQNSLHYFCDFYISLLCKVISNFKFTKYRTLTQHYTSKTLSKGKGTQTVGDSLNKLYNIHKSCPLKMVGAYILL